MTKHGKNSTAHPVYSHHERKRDSKESGFGTIERRITGDSMQKLNHCCLTNQKCNNPVITPEGYVYEKEALIEYILKQKDLFKSKKKAYSFAMKQKDIKSKEEEKNEISKIKKEFIKTEGFTSTKVGKAKTSDTPPLHSSNSHLSCFWLPSLAPEAEEIAEKPNSEVVRCPFSGKPLKLSRVIPIKFTTPPEDPNTFICAVSGDILTNSTACFVLKTTGDVVTQNYVNKILKKPGDSYMQCPFTGKQLQEKDLISMKAGGSWYSSSGESHIAKMVTPAILTS